jgi:signal recognition particle GTPase
MLTKAQRWFEDEVGRFQREQRIIEAMTPAERQQFERFRRLEWVAGSRLVRIAEESGTSVADVETFLKDYWWWAGTLPRKPWEVW